MGIWGERIGEKYGQNFFARIDQGKFAGVRRQRVCSSERDVEEPVSRLRIASVFEIFVQWLVSLRCVGRNNVGGREQYLSSLRDRETGCWRADRLGNGPGLRGRL